MTDVPGHTRGMVPLLAEAGVQFLHVGVNPASTPPAVPPVFRWRDEASGSELIMAYHRKYGETTTWPGLDHALAICFTGDNKGPQSLADVQRIFAQRRGRFPHARVRSSTLDAFARQLVKHRDGLPVVTAEMGDTWIHGVGTDPTKVARFRELARLRQAWLARRAGRPLSKALHRFSRSLLLVAEHTWGMDEKENLGDFETYKRTDFESARRTSRWRRFEKSWQEQRSYLDQAIAALPASLRRQAGDRLATLEPARPDIRQFQRVPNGTTIDTGRWQLAIDPTTGAITELLDRASNRRWASPSRQLAAFSYEVFGSTDYARFLGQYLTRQPEWAVRDFSKPGLHRAIRRHRCYRPASVTTYRRPVSDGTEVLVRLNCPREAWRRFGAPALVTLHLFLPETASEVALDLQWFDKPASRIAEAMWLSFQPRVTPARGWKLEKLATWVDPLDVVRDGNRKLHATSGTIVHAGRNGRMEITSLDAPLVAPGAPSLLDFNNRQPPLARGMHVNLFNNVWGTNFPMWNDENARFRFRLRSL
ncbi:MAG: DUF5054 domain-containing protein [Phycisphaeraceae bacterium]